MHACTAYSVGVFAAPTAIFDREKVRVGLGLGLGLAWVRDRNAALVRVR